MLVHTNILSRSNFPKLISLKSLLIETSCCFQNLLGGGIGAASTHLMDAPTKRSTFLRRCIATEHAVYAGMTMSIARHFHKVVRFKTLERPVAMVASVAMATSVGKAA